MATRSTISKREQDGSIYSIYCHWDGYIEGVGHTLKKHYTTSKQVDELIKLGSLSSLGDTPETCVAYHRDRGEDEVVIYHSWLLQDVPFEEFNYIFDNGTWKLITLSLEEYDNPS